MTSLFHSQELADPGGWKHREPTGVVSQGVWPKAAASQGGCGRRPHVARGAVERPKAAAPQG